MARQNRIDAILDLDLKTLKGMSRRDLASNISKLASAGNKRIRRLEKSGVPSPALDYVQRHGGDFSVKGKTKEQLIIEFNRVSDFLTAKTSTVRGAKTWKKNVAKSVFKKTAGEYKTKAEETRAFKEFEKKFEKREKEFWDLYGRLKNEYHITDKYKAWEIIESSQDSNISDFDTLWDNVKTKWENDIIENTREKISDLNIRG